jgi:hypothetical protein
LGLTWEVKIAESLVMLAPALVGGDTLGRPSTNCLIGLWLEDLRHSFLLI